MYSVNYFIYMHGFYLFIIKVLIIVVILFIFIAITLFIEKYFKLSENISTIILILLGILGLVGGSLTLGKIINPVDLGGVKSLYVYKSKNISQLTVWFTRIHNPGRIPGVTYYDQRLTAFNMDSGKILNYIEMSKKDMNDEYRILQLPGNIAWGYSKKTGLHLLNILKPELIADQKDILLQNKELGDHIELYYEDYIIDPITQGIHVRTKENEIYRVDTDLKTYKVNVRSLKKSYFYNLNSFQNEWIHSSVNATLGQNLNKKGFQLSKECKYLLYPQFIDELNPDPVIKNKIWVRHKSSIYDNYELILSLIDEEGRELEQINLFNYFKNKNIHILGTYTQDKEVLIFVGIGTTHRAKIKGFTLYALKTDSDTGKIIKKIRYF